MKYDLKINRPSLTGMLVTLFFALLLVIGVLFNLFSGWEYYLVLFLFFLLCLTGYLDLRLYLFKKYPISIETNKESVDITYENGEVAKTPYSSISTVQSATRRPGSILVGFLEKREGGQKYKGRSVTVEKDEIAKKIFEDIKSRLPKKE